jgi:hypothetical protein
MNRTPAIICVNGIRVDLNHGTWTRQFNLWLDMIMGDMVKANRYEYHCSAAFRFVGQRKRADELLELVNDYKNSDRDIILVGHSNGNDLIQRILNLGVHVREAHCFSPAAFEADFARAINKGSLKRMFIYGSPKDKALRLARDSNLLTKALSFLLKPFGVPALGYGYLGLNGAAFAAKFPGIVTDCSQPDFDHSTWFEEEHFESTMRQFQTNFLSSQTPPQTP